VPGLVTGNPLPDEAVAVAPLIGLMPSATARAGAWSRPWSLLVLLLLFAACLATGLLLAVRAISRESAAVRARADFLTSVTHELKTPLSSIRLLAEMLEQERVPSAEKRAEYHRLLAGEAGRLSALVENVLDLGRIERGERSYDLREARVDDIVRETVRLFAPVAERDGLRLSVSLEPGTARVDAGALSQAILNVMENARKYAAAGKDLSVQGAASGSGYRILVRDHGPGVPDDEREAIFERFRRGRAQADGSVPGVGLGLYLARAILRAHGGDLTCIAPPGGGQGACFVGTVSGPNASDSRDRTGAGSAEEPGVDAEDGGSPVGEPAGARGQHHPAVDLRPAERTTGVFRSPLRPMRLTPEAPGRCPPHTAPRPGDHRARPARRQAASANPTDSVLTPYPHAHSAR
jgi:signal transduction histidine kinase